MRLSAREATKNICKNVERKALTKIFMVTLWYACGQKKVFLFYRAFGLFTVTMAEIGKAGTAYAGDIFNTFSFP